jgi:hypothetical protein
MQRWDGLRRMLAATDNVQSAMLFDSVSAFPSSSNTSLRNDNALLTFYAAVSVQFFLVPHMVYRWFTLLEARYWY